MGLDIDLNTSKVDISEDDGLNVDLYKDNIDISDDETDDIIIEITGLKSLNKFIGLEDTPLYYDNGKFFKVENNKVVYTDIEWKDISGNIQEAPEIVDLITELIEETSEHIIDRHINIHNNSEEAHPYIQNIIQENYNTLDEKVDNLETELSEDISNLNTALNTEITNREDADSVLGARIDSISGDIQAEAITRLENDTILQNNINTLSDSLTAEISTRETADSNLSDSISDLSDDLIQEILDRQAGDNNLDSIKANVSDVESITGALADSISALDSTVSANYETLDDKIDSVNGALSDSITALDSVVSENYNTLDDKIDSINSALSDSISGLDTKYTSITGALSDSITALDNKYDTITNNLSDSITALDNKYDSITSGLGDEIDNVEGALNTHTSNTSNPHNVTKAQVGLGNVDNTSDLNKPISTAAQSALDGKVPNTRTVNNKALSSDITLTYTDVNALPDTTTINDLTTATQQNALNSGINSTLTQQITTNQNNISNLSSTVSSNYTTLDNRITSEVNTLNSSISDEETARINADNGLQSQIDAITSASDVTDIVGTYAELQAYDTTSLPDKSIIKVLQDESRNGETTYYRWVITNGTGAWTLIGEEGPYYTKSEADGRFVTQTTTVNNKALSSNITLTASDVGALPDSTVIGNGTLTIQKNSTTIDTFNANATSNKTINISVPTDTSDLTNNAGFISGITSSDVVNALGYTPENISNKVTSLSSSSTDTQYPSAKLVYDELNEKQETLVSGTNIKTINNNSLLGNGNVTIDSLPSQSGQSGKYLTTNGTTASWSTVSIPTVDQTYDGTSTNAQSGVAISGELENYVNGRNGNIEISNDGVLADITYYYIDNDTLQEQYSVQVGATMMGHGTLIGAKDYTDSENLKEFGVAVVPEGFGISDGNQNVLLNISNNNLTVNGTEVALTTDIPDISTKQDTLVSGTNIKTINNTSLLGSGNLSVGTVKSVNNTQPDNNGNISLTIPTVNNATLTIQKNGTTVNTFTANSSSDVTCNITIPTAVTDLSDASDYVTNTGLMAILDDYATEQWTQQQASSLYTSIQGWVNNQGYAVSANLADVATTGDYDDLLNKPTIPQAQIQSDWNQTDSSAVDFIKNKPTIPSGVIVDQVYDGTSTNAQSGVAIEGELANYVKGQNGNITISNTGTEASIVYIYKEEGTPQQAYGITLGETSEGKGVFLVSVDQAEQKGYAVGVVPNGFGIEDILNNRGALLSVSSSGNLAVNGSEVILRNNIDSSLSTTSENPVQNKVIAQAIEDISLAKNPNLNVIGGSLNIDSGNISGFSTTDYMQFPFVFNFNGYTWTLEMGFTTGSDITTQQNILDSYYGVAFAINNGKFLTALSSNGSSWDIGNTSGTYSVQANTAYSVKIAWDGTNYTLSYALDETNYTTDITIPSSAVHHSAQEYVGGEPELFGSGSQHPFTGTINLNKWNLIVNGLEVWLGMDVVGLGSRANIDLSNLTSAGIDTIRLNSPVQTVNNTQPDSNGNISIEIPTNYVTTNTAQDISGRKTFLGEKAIYFKQSATTNKLGFTLYNPSNTELGALEYRPNTISGASLLALNCPQTTSGYVGFRYWGTPAVNIVAPKVATAGNYYIPTHITNGSTTVTASNNGTVNISTLLPDISGYATQSWVQNQNYLTSSDLTDYVTNTSLTTTLSDYVLSSDLSTTLDDYALKSDIPDISTKQDTLVSGTNIKTINNTSIVGSGNIEVLQNTANHNNSLCIYGTLVSGMSSTEYGTAVGYLTKAGVYSNAFGYNAKATGSWAEVFGGNITVSGDWSVGIGHNNDISGNHTVAIGANGGGSSFKTTGNYATCLGCYSNATADYATCLGSSSKATANSAIQIGYGTNSTANSLNIGFRNASSVHYNWQLLDGTTGLIPDARLSTNIARTSDIPDISTKQDTLVSGTNIKTINNTSVLGGGNISVLQNTATGTNSLTILGTVASSNGALNIGNNSAADAGGVSLGNSAISYTYSTAIGYGTHASGTSSIQLGYGTNPNAKTMRVGFFDSANPRNYELLDGTTGLIPDARISTNIARTNQIITPTYDSTNERITW